MKRIAVAALVSWSSIVAAEPDDPDALFERGRALLAAGKTAEACDAFERSQQREAATVTQLNLAACRETNGQLATALALFREVEHATDGATDGPTRQLHTIAKTKASSLATRVSKLTIRVGADVAVDGLVIRRDGKAIDAGTWNHAVPIDGGTYEITARAPGVARWSTRVTVAEEGDGQIVDVPRLGTNDVRREPAQRSLVVPASVGAGALALGITAVVIELEAESTYNQALAATTLPGYEGLYGSANNQRYVAEGFAVGAVACAGVAVAIYLAGRSSHTAVAVTPAGVAMSGRF